MSKKEYIPGPINLDNVKLPEGLDQLIETISKNVHEVWASGRIKDGWKYGSERNDNLKTHPCLIHYDELPEVEKQYDRETVLNTIKLVIKSGYKILK